MIVTFCGHAEIENDTDMKQWLNTVLDRLIQKGANTFYLGGYGKFDTLSASVLQKKKDQYPQIRLILVLPYLNFNIDTSIYDDSVYPPLESVPPKYAILKRNQWMVEQSDIVVAYVLHGWGGAAKTLRYAQQKKKEIISFPR
ncbi:hypothetical protein [uncultured Negativibacillus sp.]|uniref:hypothetical protein n=1 Tax=uncultured Negativibacillus sp. TaxID=1980696 RepID=UPI0025F565F6|nr:hypothetical protein [uncultured Negativibacillus sp.]